MSKGMSEGDTKRIRSYFEANRIMLGRREEINASIINTFLGVCLWGGTDYRSDPMTLEGLAEKAGLPTNTVSRHLRYLSEYERSGKPGMNLVATEIYHLNRRQKVAFLTSEGIALRDQLAFTIGAGDASPPQG